MRDQVFMSPNNGQLVVAIPLFRHHEQALNAQGFTMWVIHSAKPLAYVIDMDKHGYKVLSAEWVEKKLICLGEL